MLPVTDTLLPWTCWSAWILVNPLPSPLKPEAVTSPLALMSPLAVIEPCTVIAFWIIIKSVDGDFILGVDKNVEADT